MSISPRIITKSILNILLIIFGVLYLLSCFSSFADPSQFWIFGVLALCFPLLLLFFIIILFIFLIVKNRRELWWMLLLLLPAFFNIKYIAAVNFNSAPVINKENTITIISWNVARFGDLEADTDLSRHRQSMYDLLMQQGADVICMQEFTHSDTSFHFPHLNYFIDSSRYPYYYYIGEDDGYYGRYRFGNIILSKYPLIDSGKIRYGIKEPSETLMWVDIKKGADTIRVYNTRLQSFLLKRNEIKSIQNSEVDIEQSVSLAGKLKKGFAERSRQAKLVKKQLALYHGKFILCGDFNDVPSSFTYRHISAGYNDAFLQKGNGIGKTFYEILPALRIDFIFSSMYTEARSFEKINSNLSDHAMIKAVIGF